MDKESAESVVRSLSTYLNPKVWNDPGAMSRVSRGLAEGGLVVIRNGLVESFAERIFHCLDKSSGWKLNEQYESGSPFHYHHHNINEWELFPPDLKWCHQIFSSNETKQWIERLAGQECRGITRFSASWYQRGDHSLPHSDLLVAGDEERRVAFVWHLTKAWREEWGGALYWCPKQHYLPPSFNTLVLFSVADDRNHFVTQVSPHAEAKRLTINGWWYGKTKERSDRGVVPNFRNEADIEVI